MHLFVVALCLIVVVLQCCLIILQLFAFVILICILSVFVCVTVWSVCTLCSCLHLFVVILRLFVVALCLGGCFGPVIVLHPFINVFVIFLCHFVVILTGNQARNTAGLQCTEAVNNSSVFPFIDIS